MVYLASQLIADAYDLSEVVGTDYQSVSGAQSSKGLIWLNQLLEQKASQTSFIPYFEYNTTITAVQGQESYFIPNAVYIESVTYNVDTTLRLAVNMQNRRGYFGSDRVDNIQALPDSCNFLRAEGGGTLYLYPLPAGNYPLKIMGKFALTDVSLNTDMSASYDGYYILYLTFALAKYICMRNGAEFTDAKNKEMTRMEYDLLNISSPDMSCKRGSFFNTGGNLNVTSINYYRGYYPGSL